MELCKRWPGFAAGILLAACVCWAQESDDGVRRRLLEMKGDDDQAAMVAEMELVAMGDKALAPLKKIIDDGKDAQRAEALRVFPGVLEKAGRLTRVTINRDSARLSELLDDLNGQCGRYSIGSEGNLSGKRGMTYHCEKAPYNIAAMDICRKVDGRLNEERIFGKWVIRDSIVVKRDPISASWGDLVILDEIKCEKSIDYEEGKRQEMTLTASLRTMVDRGSWALYGGVFKDVEATDEAGRKLALGPASGIQSTEPFSAFDTHELKFLVPEESKKLAKLSGKEMECIGYDLETWTIDDLSKAGGTEHDFGGVKLKIGGVTISGLSVLIEGSLEGIRIPYGAQINPAIQKNSMIPIISRMFVPRSGTHDSWRVSSVGQKNYQETIDGNSQSVGFSVRFAISSGAMPPDLRIEATLPRKFAETWIDFEFKDIELP